MGPKHKTKCEAWAAITKLL